MFVGKATSFSMFCSQFYHYIISKKLILCVCILTPAYFILASPMVLLLHERAEVGGRRSKSGREAGGRERDGGKCGRKTIRRVKGGWFFILFRRDHGGTQHYA